jgi:hypothetical protein
MNDRLNFAAESFAVQEAALPRYTSNHRNRLLK